MGLRVYNLVQEYRSMDVDEKGIRPVMKKLQRNYLNLCILGADFK